MCVTDFAVQEKDPNTFLKNTKKVVLFGAGGAGVQAASFLKEKGIEVLFFCDNDVKKHGKFIEGVKVVSPGELERYKDEIVLISSDYAKEIGLQIKELGVRKFYYFGYCFDFERWYGHFDSTYIRRSGNAIEEAYNTLADNNSREVFASLLRFRLTSDPTYLVVSDFGEYFHPRVKPRPGDTIIDGGAWAGDTAISFAEYLNGKCKVFSFEPDTHNYNLLLKNITKKSLEEIVSPIQLGLWENRAVLRFSDSSENDMQFRISEEGKKKIGVISIDGFGNEKKQRIDLIKMDIEGAEFEAINGARNTIERFSPRLQICLYHQVDDLWRIPLLIKSINPKYELYIAHHTQNLFGTILYAVVD